MSKIAVTLGIDIGGTNTVFGLVDEKGKCYLKNSVPTQAEDPAIDLFNRLFEKFKGVYDSVKENYELKGIGIGAPNANYYTGSVVNPPNLNWGVVNLVDLTKKYLDIPVAVTNDANAAALGEMMFGAAKEFKNFIEITLGTGLGSGIIVNGDLVYGHDGFAGELGHVIVEPEGRLCGCGRRGCLETYSSATGIKRTVYQMLADQNGTDSILREIPFTQLTAKDVSTAVKKGDKIGEMAFEYTGKILGRALANAVTHTSPEAIVLFGGLANAGELIFEPVRRHFEENLLYVFKNKIKVIPSGLEEGNVAVLGAGALIWKELSK